MAVEDLGRGFARNVALAALCFPAKA